MVVGWLWDAAARPGKRHRGGKRHYIALRKHTDKRTPLHPTDDLEAVCYLLMARDMSLMTEHMLLALLTAYFLVGLLVGGRGWVSG